MGKNTNIEWTATLLPNGGIRQGHSWNPWQGCKKVSPACHNCYMYRDKKRFGQDATKVIRSSKRTFELPLRIKEPSTVFTCSWSDFFIEEADGWRDEAWEIIRKTPHLTYLILTKRPENILNRLPYYEYLNNVWVGITAENQEYFIDRIEHLSFWRMPKFISVEPMLGEIDISEYETHIDWVICGGETGLNARQINLDYARKLRDQCKEYGIPFFFKQNTNKSPIPDDLKIQQLPGFTF